MFRGILTTLLALGERLFDGHARCPRRLQKLRIIRIAVTLGLGIELARGRKAAAVPARRCIATLRPL
jgi:hypothetical protein